MAAILMGCCWWLVTLGVMGLACVVYSVFVLDSLHSQRFPAVLSVGCNDLPGAYWYGLLSAIVAYVLF
ncbi:MAG TPA: hypothetical protein ACQGQH_03920 [Xylella sp.]